MEERLLAAAADTGTAVICNLPFGRGRLPDAAMRRKMVAFVESLG